MHSLTQTMEFARASVVCVFLSYNKKENAAEISVEISVAFFVLQISVLQQIDMKYRKSYNRTDRRLRTVLV